MFQRRYNAILTSYSDCSDRCPSYTYRRQVNPSVGAWARVGCLRGRFFLLTVAFKVCFFTGLLRGGAKVLLLGPVLLAVTIVVVFLGLAGVSFRACGRNKRLVRF